MVAPILLRSPYLATSRDAFETNIPINLLKAQTKAYSLDIDSDDLDSTYDILQHNPLWSRSATFSCMESVSRSYRRLAFNRVRRRRLGR